MAIIKSFDELNRQVIELAKKQTCPGSAIIISDDDHNLKSIQQLTEDRVLRSLFIGAGDSADDNNSFIKAADIINALSRTLGMANDKQIDLIVLDENYLTDFLKMAQNKSSGFITSDRILSHAAVFEHEVYHKTFMLCDAFVNSHPDLIDKVKIIKNAVGLSKILGVELPKAAILAAVEKVHQGMAVTIEAERLKSMNIEGEIDGCLIDGPLSMDCAMIKKVAEDKGVASEVAGDPDILIAPDINVANAIYHAITKIGQAKMGSLIIGGSVPVALLHSNNIKENAINSLMLGSYYSLISNN
ncbi:MAG: phosphate acyltransferase [candidate division Zixibacteria bacterium]